MSNNSSNKVLRVGIDPRSDDHTILSQTDFSDKKYQFIETDFTKIPRAILLGEIDMGIWHKVETMIPLEILDLSIEPISDLQT